MRTLFAAILLSGLAVSGTAQAQTRVEGRIAGRVDRLEREMRAVQRKVFPEGAGKYFAPQITPDQQPQAQPGSPSGGALVNLEQRVGALEQQLSTMTGQIEQNQYKLRQLQSDFEAYKKATDARLEAPAGSGDTDTTADGVNGGGTLEGQMADRGSAEDSEPPAASGARADAVAAIERPDSGNAAEDAYIYGYRLWKAKLYPEAETQLKSVVAKYPDSRRASFAQNLLGRAYLDEGKPSLASIAFYDNYKDRPDGERAPDSLFYLAKALIQLKKNPQACQVYDQLQDSYGDRISASMQGDIAAGRDTADCQ